MTFEGGAGVQKTRAVVYRDHGIEILIHSVPFFGLESLGTEVRLNGWSSRVRIVNAGLSQDRAPLYVEASLTKSGTRAAERQARAKSLKVPSYRLDDLIDPGAEICFLKADCQGCEGDAFLSGSQLLGAGKIKVVMLEFDHTDRARDALSTLQKLSPRPFHCLLIPLGLTCEGEQINDPKPGRVEFSPAFGSGGFAISR